MSSHQRLVSILIGLMLAGEPRLQAWSPGTGSPLAVVNFTVDTTDRTDVLAFYNTVYLASENYASEMAWNGDVAGNIAGTTSLAFKNDVQRRVNFYRALVGVPAVITFNDTFSAKDQLAALMLSANQDPITHNPPPTWNDYSADGAEAAGHSNIARGTGIYGPAAVDGYMLDFGDNNAEVGHRRWILYSRAQVMGTGDIPDNGPYLGSNALWNDINTTNPVAPIFEKWPNAGYSPFPLMPARWSVAYRDADFTQATVTMTQGRPRSRAPSSTPTAMRSTATPSLGRTRSSGNRAVCPPRLAAIRRTR